MTAYRQKATKSRSYKIVLWIILITMSSGSVIFILSSIFQKGFSSSPGSFLNINGKSVSRKEYEQRLLREQDRLYMLRQQFGKYADTLLKMYGFTNPQDVAEHALINETLMQKVADELNLDVTSDFIMQKLYNPSFVVNELAEAVPLQVLDQKGNINMLALTQWLQRQGKSMAEFEQDLEKAFKRKVAADIIGASAFVSPQEVKEYFIAEYLKKKYSIIELPFEVYLKKAREHKFSEQEIQDFFTKENTQHKRYWTPETRTASVWTFEPTAYGVTVKESDIESYYEKNKQSKFMDQPVSIELRRILLIKDDTNATAVAAKAQELKEKLVANPQDFTTLAQQYSDDKKTAAKGGYIGFLKRGDKDNLVWRTALSLKKDGDVSDFIMTNEGIEVFQRVSRKAATYKKLETVKNDIHTLLLNQKFRKKFTRDAERIIANIKEDKKAFDLFVTDKKGQASVLENQTKQATKLGQKLFKTKKGAYAQLFDEKGNGIVFMVSDLKKSQESSLNEAKAQVVEDMYAVRAQKMLKEDLKSLENKLKTADSSAVANEKGLKVMNTGWLKKDDSDELEKLEKKAIPVQKLLFSSERKGSVTSAFEDGNGYLAKLEAVEPYQDVIFNDKKQEVMRKLSQEKKELATRAFVASLRKNATIERTKEEPGARREIPLSDIF
ncbi:MAG: peptidylprolyl isomerase [Candidatus Babeliales bacterium]